MIPLELLCAVSIRICVHFIRRVSLIFIRFLDGIRAIKTTFCLRACHPKRPRIIAGGGGGTCLQGPGR